MSGFFLALALAVRPADVHVTIAVPARSDPPAAVLVEWADRKGDFLREDRIALRSGALHTPVPADAESLRIVGGGFASRSISIADAARAGARLSVGPTATVRVVGVPEGTTAPVFLWAAPPKQPEMSDFAPASPPAVRRRAAVVQTVEGKRSAVVELPAGKYAVALEAGAASVPLLIGDVDVPAGGTRSVEWPAADSGRELTLVARERDSGKPLAAARIGAGAVEPGRRVLEVLLDARAGASGADGLLRVGRVSTTAFTMTVSARGRRRAAANIPAGETATRRDVRLAPYQSIRVSLTGLPRSEVRPAVLFGRCDVTQTWMPCNPKQTVTRALDESNHAVFAASEPGGMLVALDWRADRRIRRVVLVSADSEDPDVMEVELAVSPARFRGRTVLADGRPVEASINVRGNGNSPSRYGNVTSSADGSFDISVLLPDDEDRGPWLTATTESPKGMGNWVPSSQPKPWETYQGEDDIRIVVHTGEFRVHLRDRKTEAPIPGCPLSGEITFPDGMKSQALKSDDEGDVSFSSLQSGSVAFQPRCDGYVKGKRFDYTFAEGEERDETLLLDRAHGITVTFLDSRGAPVAGALLLGQDVAQSHVAGSLERVGDYFNPALEIGISDAEGRISVDGEQWNGVPYFATASGRALALGRLPSAIDCESSDECSTTVVFEPRNPFPGLLLRPNASGHRANPKRILVDANGTPIPLKVLEELVSVNGSSEEQMLEPTEDGLLFLLPSLLPAGVYDVSTTSKFDPKTGYSLLPVARITVPATDRVAVTLPDGIEGSQLAQSRR